MAMPFMEPILHSRSAFSNAMTPVTTQTEEQATGCNLMLQDKNEELRDH